MQFHAAAAPFQAAINVNNIWTNVLAMIRALMGAGLDATAVKAQVDALINQVQLPFWATFAKPFIIAAANSVIDAFFAQAAGTPPKPVA